jgi:transposase
VNSALIRVGSPNGGKATKALATELSEEQKQIRRLQKELKDAQLERDILKKAVGIFSRGDGKYSDL